MRRAVEYLLQLLLQSGKLAFGIGRFQKINVFFGKIEGGFYQHPQRNQVFHQIVNAAGKRAFERANRHPCRRLAGGVDQIGHALGLRQIQFVVEKRPFGELSRLGQLRAQF